MSAAIVRTLKIALLGCGTVGHEVAKLLTEHADEFAARVGAPVELAGIAVRHPEKHSDIPSGLLTTDAHELVKSDVDIVVELIGGIEPARELLLSALHNGKSVVTANKALLAESTAELSAAAERGGADLYFEAAVAGSIPLIRPLRESLAGDRITQVMGIVNGTTNFVLSTMESTGGDYADALAEASQRGYAEADPSADVDGHDAAAKAAILASLAFHTRVTAADVYREGITKVGAADIAAARSLGRVIKLLAICERVNQGDEEMVSARVYPAMIPRHHQLASVQGAFNAVYVQADAAGELMFYGQGAGGSPTASAVLGDVVAIARNRVLSGRGPRETVHANLPIQPIGHTTTRYYVSLDVEDRAGVLAQVAHIFAEHDVSIATVRQYDRFATASLVIVTHSAREAALKSIVDQLAQTDVVRQILSVMRVEGED